MNIMSLLSESEEYYNDLNSHSSYGIQRLRGYSRYNRDFLSYAPQEVEIERTLSNPYGFPLGVPEEFLYGNGTLFENSGFSSIVKLRYYFRKRDMEIER